MNIKNKETSLILMSTVLWVGVMLSGWYGQWYAGMFQGLLIMFIYMMMGSAKNGVVSKKLLGYPLLSWLILWSAGFYFTQKYALQFQDKVADFTILGFHPSFAFIVFFYWVGGVLTLTIGLNLFKNEWLSQEEWNAFKTKVKQIDAENASNTRLREEA